MATILESYEVGPPSPTPPRHFRDGFVAELSGSFFVLLRGPIAYYIVSLCSFQHLKAQEIWVALRFKIIIGTQNCTPENDQMALTVH